MVMLDISFVAFLPSPIPYLPLSLKYSPESNVRLPPVGAVRHCSIALQDLVNAWREVNRDSISGR